MSASDWERLLAEGRETVEIVRRGLRNRGINAGESIMTDFGTDEDIPVYSSDGERKLFWISVKSVAIAVHNPRSWGVIEDRRKTNILEHTAYLYPSWLVSPKNILNKEEIISHIQRLVQ